MKKRSIRIIVALVILAVLCAAYFAIKAVTEKSSVTEDSAAEDEDITVISGEAGELTSLYYKNSKADVRYICRNGQWSYENDPEFPLTQNKLTQLAEDVAQIKAKRDITDEGANETDYGFDEPTLTLRLTYSDGRECECTVGIYNTLAQAYYLKYDSRIYMVSSDIVEACDYTLFDMLTTTSLASIDSSDIKGFSVNGTDITDADIISEAAKAYSGISVGKAEDYKNAEKYGFDGTQNTVTVKYVKNTDVTDDSGNTTSSAQVDYDYTFSFVFKGDMSYIMLPDDTLIYNVTGLDTFMEALDYVIVD